MTFQRISRIGICLIVSAVCGFSQAQPTEVRANPIRSLQEVRALSPAAAAKGLRAEVTGVVTCSRSGDSFFQDQTAGIFLAFPRIRSTFQPGERLVIHGITDPGKFAPTLKPVTIRRLGLGPLPQPRTLSLESIQTGAYDPEYVRIRAIVRAATKEEGLLNLVLYQEGLRLPVVVATAPGRDLSSLIGRPLKSMAVLAATSTRSVSCLR